MNKAFKRYGKKPYRCTSYARSPATLEGLIRLTAEAVVASIIQNAATALTARLLAKSSIEP